MNEPNDDKCFFYTIIIGVIFLVFVICMMVGSCSRLNDIRDKTIAENIANGREVVLVVPRGELEANNAIARMYRAGYSLKTTIASEKNNIVLIFAPNNLE